MVIKPWKKIGPEKILAESHQRMLVTQKFQDPLTKKTREHSIFVARRPFSCIVLGITTENKVLAVKQYRKAVEEVVLELPGGCPKFTGQDIESAAREELAEETGGYEPGAVISLQRNGCWFEPSGLCAFYFPFLFLECRKTLSQAKSDDGEYTELVEIPLPYWIEMCLTGKINDSKSIVSTTLALPHLGYRLQMPDRRPIF